MFIRNAADETVDGYGAPTNAVDTVRKRLWSALD